MPLNVNIGHITGSAKVNSLFPQDIEWRKRRSITQMFFAPYESGREFFYCASHIVFPVATVAVAVLHPVSLGICYGVAAGLIAISGIVAGISKLFNCNEVSSSCTKHFLDSLSDLTGNILQTLVDLVLLPISVLMLVTRSVSTGLHTVGICKETQATQEKTAESNPAFATTNPPQISSQVHEPLTTSAL